jgi:hypothetical protein
MNFNQGKKKGKTAPAVILLNLLLKTATSTAVPIKSAMPNTQAPLPNTMVAQPAAGSAAPVLTAPQNALPQPNNIVGSNIINSPINLQGNVIPQKITITINSSASGAVAASILLFNNQALGAASTDPTKTVFTWSDGFNGTLFERLLVQAGDKGIQVFGFNVTCKDTVSGLPDTPSLNAMNATLLNYTGFGRNAVPSSFDVSGTERKTDFKDGIMTIISPFILTSLAQFNYQQPVNKEFQFTFYLVPIVN